MLITTYLTFLQNIFHIYNILLFCCLLLILTKKVFAFKISCCVFRFFLMRKSQNFKSWLLTHVWTIFCDETFCGFHVSIFSLLYFAGGKMLFCLYEIHFVSWIQIQIQFLCLLKLARRTWRLLVFIPIFSKLFVVFLSLFKLLSYLQVSICEFRCAPVATKFLLGAAQLLLNDHPLGGGWWASGFWQTTVVTWDVFTLSKGVQFAYILSSVPTGTTDKIHIGNIDTNISWWIIIYSFLIYFKVLERAITYLLDMCIKSGHRLLLNFATIDFDLLTFHKTRTHFGAARWRRTF